MIHTVMGNVLIALNPAITRPIVGIDGLMTLRGMLLNEAMEEAARWSLLDLQADFAVSLDRAEHHRFVVHRLHTTSLPADVGLIHFHGSFEGCHVGVFHRRSNPVTKIPRSLIADAKDALEP